MAPRPGSALGALIVLAGLSGGVARASAPDWLTKAADEKVVVAADADAVVLLDRRETSLDSRGQIRILERRVVRILRSGSRAASAEADSSESVNVKTLRAWHLTTEGKTKTFTARDAVREDPGGANIHSDRRREVLHVTDTAPGSVVGFEMETVSHRDGPFLVDVWDFQETVPVHRAQLALSLPPGWSASPVWIRHAAVAPEAGGVSWELDDVPPVPVDKESMPPIRAVAAWMGVRFVPPGGTPGTWSDLGRWYAGITESAFALTPGVEAETSVLTAGESSTLKKIEKLAAFVQGQTRYVAVEFGMGNLQPRAASEVLANRFGDCKDKATLLKSMLQAAGIRSHYVLINHARGVTAPEFPSIAAFDHVVLAVPLEEVPPARVASAVVDDPALGRLVFFDATDDLVPFGSLSPAIDGGLGLVVTSTSGKLVRLPSSGPNENSTTRTAKLSMSEAGAISGSVEIRSRGRAARALRGAFEGASAAKTKNLVETWLGSDLGDVAITDIQVENAANLAGDLVVRFKVSASRFGSNSGRLLLLRPSIFRAASIHVDWAHRKAPLAFTSTFADEEDTTIELPPSLAVDELPRAVTTTSAAGAFSMQIHDDGGSIRVHEAFAVGNTDFAADHLGDLKSLVERANASEKSSLVLKRR